MSKRVIGVVVAVAIIVVAGLVALQLRNKDSSRSDSALQKAAKEADTLLAGIPQQGEYLGNTSAPVTITEFLDYKCPVCKAAESSVVPQLITKYVRPGTARIRLRPILLGAQSSGQAVSNLGPDSEIGALAGIATADTNRMWQFTKIMYATQGNESTQWITDGVVTNAVKAAGIDVGKWQPVYKGNEVVNTLFANIDAALAAHYTGTPYFVVSGPKGTEGIKNWNDLASYETAVNKVK
ncbi:MAG: thioredoxin domain-containing protein [Thermoleophilia bacterium]